MLIAGEWVSVFAVIDAVTHELGLFAAFWFAVGALDEIAIDLCWVLLGRERAAPVDGGPLPPLERPFAVMIPAWQEATVLAAMLGHLRHAWPDEKLAIYVGVYPNDCATLAAAAAGAERDSRVRVVVNDTPGPTTKADCLNRLYRALGADELRRGTAYHGVILQDAEDMVHPRALGLIARELADGVFVQLPVVPQMQADSRWIGSHYCDEFAEAHGRTMVVRERLGAGLPAAGVGCGFSRGALARLAREMDGVPFCADALTEDYELGLKLSAMGRARFLLARDERGELIATREFFPHHLAAAVRQKARWVHGIAFQGWERIDWGPGLADMWMQMRDRRSPLTALVLLVGYLVVPLFLIVQLGEWLTPFRAGDPGWALKALLWFNFFAFVWRAGWRVYFTGRIYGMRQGFRALLRIPVANVIAIMAARRSLSAYVRSLSGGGWHWEKTPHTRHSGLADGWQAA